MPELDTAFAALGDPVRRALVTRLSRGDATVGELAEPFGLSQQAISHHVGVLRRSGLIEQRRDGTRRPCRLRIDRLSELGGWIDEQRRAWADRLDALDRHLGDTGAAEAARRDESDPEAERRDDSGPAAEWRGDFGRPR